MKKLSRVFINWPYYSVSASEKQTAWQRMRIRSCWRSTGPNCNVSPARFHLDLMKEKTATCVLKKFTLCASIVKTLAHVKKSRENLAKISPKWSTNLLGFTAVITKMDAENCTKKENTKSTSWIVITEKWSVLLLTVTRRSFLKNLINITSKNIDWQTLFLWTTCTAIGLTTKNQVTAPIFILLEKPGKMVSDRYISTSTGRRIFT